MSTASLPRVKAEQPVSVESPQRLLSLDVLRGLTIAGMILVTDPGTYGARYGFLAHAEWDHPTATDLIFPCFLVMVGVSLVLSFGARRFAAAGAAARGAADCIGAGGEWVPDVRSCASADSGILQRIGVCYALAALLYLALKRPGLTRARRVGAIGGVCAVLLAGYWALLKLYPTPGFGPGRLDSLGSLPTVVDRAVFGVAHLWIWGLTPGYGVTYDSEGILSTTGALATVLFGVLAGELLQRDETRGRRCGQLAVFGTALWLAGLGLSPWLVQNKKILTSTFALSSSGLSLLALAGLFYVIDVRGWRRGWTLPLIFGTNAIFAFVLSGVVTTLLDLFSVRTAKGPEHWHHWLHEQLFATWLPPRPSSLAYAVAIVLLNAALVYPLYRRRIFLRL